MRVSVDFFDLMKKKHATEMPEVDFTEFTKFVACDKIFKRPLRLRAHKKRGGGLDFELDFTPL